MGPQPVTLRQTATRPSRPSVHESQGHPEPRANRLRPQRPARRTDIHSPCTAGQSSRPTWRRRRLTTFSRQGPPPRSDYTPYNTTQSTEWQATSVSNHVYIAFTFSRCPYPEQLKQGLSSYRVCSWIFSETVQLQFLAQGVESHWIVTGRSSIVSVFILGRAEGYMSRILTG